MFILSKIKPNANNCMDIEKKKIKTQGVFLLWVRWLGGSTRLASTYMHYIDDISVIYRHLYNILFTI